MTDKDRLPRRVLLAAASLTDAEAGLSVIKTVLDLSKAELAGLLVEPRASELATSTHHRIISSWGTPLPVPPRAEEHRRARAEARAFADRMAALAEERAVAWSVETASGDVFAAACAALRAPDILIVGQRAILRKSGPVMLIGPHGGADPQMRALAEQLAAQASSFVVDVSAGPNAPAAEIVARIDRSHAALLVVDLATAPFGDTRDLRRLLAAARCTCVVLGASRAGSGAARDG